MQIKIREILEACKAISGIQEKELPVEISFWMSRIVSMTENIRLVYDKENLKLLKKHGRQSTDNPNEFIIPNNKVEEYTAENNFILDKEEELDIKPIKLSLFQKHNISNSFFIQMAPLIDNDLNIK